MSGRAGKAPPAATSVAPPGGGRHQAVFRQERAWGAVPPGPLPLAVRRRLRRRRLLAESELGAALGRRCPARGRRFRRRGCKAEPDGLEPRAREDAMVRAALARGPFALVV